MQSEFKLSPIEPVEPKTYKWEGDIRSEKQGTKYAVLFQDKIIAMFSSLYWAERFSDMSCNIKHTIMKVDE